MKKREKAAPAGPSGLRRLALRLKTEALKKLRLQHSVDELSGALAERELLFSSPPLDADLLAAIERLTPQFHLRQNEESRRVWELSQNGSCWGEYDALAPLLESLPRPTRVLEVGPGLGRSVVFLKKKLGWEDVPFHLYEGEGRRTRYTRLGRRSSASFCGDLAGLRRVLEHNGVGAFEIFDAEKLDHRLDRLPGPYDLVYSFYGVGFHWSLEHFWGEIAGLLAEGSVGLFTVHHGFSPFAALGEVGFTTVPLERILAKDRPLRILAISKTPERLAPLTA